MKRNKKSVAAFLAAAVLVLCSAHFFAPSVLEAGWDKNECRSALLKCMFGAAVSGITNLIAGACISTFCLAGYEWCLEFAA